MEIPFISDQSQDVQTIALFIGITFASIIIGMIFKKIVLLGLARVVRSTNVKYDDRVALITAKVA